MADKPLFHIQINTDEMAQKLNQVRSVIEKVVKPAIQNLSIQTHAFIVNEANNTIKNGFHREFYLGLGEYGKDSKDSDQAPGVDQSAKNVRWSKLGDGMWMVELDSKADFIEKGRESQFMDWLLKPGDKGVKRSKDGSFYRAIPFRHTQNGKATPNTKPAFPTLIKKQAQREGVSLSKIDMDESGKPKIGMIHKLSMQPTGTQAEMPSFFSKPRTKEDSEASGLPEHGGIYKLQDTSIIQRVGPKGKVLREAVTFRVISDKHKNEGRWMAPKVEAANIFPKAYEWAQNQWTEVLKAIEQELKK